MNKQFLVWILGLTLAACTNNSGGGSKDKPATPKGYSSKITSNGRRALAGQAALFEVSNEIGKSKKQLFNVALKENSPAQGFLIAQNFNQMISAESPSESKEKAKIVNQSLQSSQCQYDIPQMSDNQGTRKGAAAELAPMKIKISGASCPVEVSMSLSMVGADGAQPCLKNQNSTHCKFGAIVKMSYRVLDEKLAQEIQVRSGYININFNIDQTLPGDNSESIDMSIKGGGQFDMKAVDLEGYAHTLSGSQDADMKMFMGRPSGGQQAQPQFQGYMKEDLQYVDERSNITSTLNASITTNGNTGSEKYYIDGNIVTRENYQREHLIFEISMMHFEGPNVGEDQSNPANPPSNPPNDGDDHQVQPPVDPPVNPPSNPPSNPPRPPPVVVTPPSDGDQNHKWVCTTKAYSDNEIFINYGKSRFIAESMVMQKCQESKTDCGFDTQCEEQVDVVSDAWFCQTKSYSTGKLFSGTGRSKTEASYYAIKSCNKQSRNRDCSDIEVSDCDHK